MASSGSGFFHVDVIVLDEVHYLSDISRGTVWEEIVSIFEFWTTYISGLSLFNVFSPSCGTYLGDLLPKRSSTYMSVSDSCKSR